MKIGILMSTTAKSTKLINDNPKLIAGELDLKIVFEDDAVDASKIDLKQLFEKVKRDGIIPKTSQPTPFEIETQIVSALQRFDKLIIVTPHSSLSGTYQSVLNSVEICGQAQDVHVFEVNGGIACTEMALIDKGIQLINEGKEFEQIIEEMTKFNSRLIIYTFPCDYNYLKLSGRVKGAQTLLLNTFNIRIVIKMENKPPIIDFKGRGEKSIFRYIEKEFSQGNIEKIYYTPIADNLDMRVQVLDILDNLNIDVEVTSEANVVPATHLGPDNFGLGVVFK